MNRKIVETEKNNTRYGAKLANDTRNYIDNITINYQKIEIPKP